MNDYKELIERLNDISNALGFESTSCVCLAADAIEQLVKERDAAVEHLSRIADCLSCKYNRFYKNGDPDTYCVHPHQSKCDGRYWEWCGVQEAEHEIDRC